LDPAAEPQVDRLHYYTDRVKWLEITPQSRELFSTDAIFALLSEAAELPIFPNLINLTWLRTTDIQHSLTLMHRHVTVVKLHIRDNKMMTTFTHEIVKRMRFLRTIQLETNIGSSGHNLDYAKCIANLAGLRIFKVGNYLDEQVFRELAGLPHLECIHAVFGSGQPGQTRLPSDLGINAFDNLRRLALSIPISGLTPSLEGGRHFGNLESLWLNTTTSSRTQHTEETTPQDFRVFASSLARTSTSIRNIHLDMQRFEEPSPTSIRMTQYIGIADIAPLFVLSTIRQFHLSHTYPLLLHNNDLAILGDSWPRLECLSLNHEPSTLKEPTLTLEVLAIIGHHSPLLRKLAISINGAVCMATLHPGIVMTQLTDLWMGVSTTRSWLDCAVYLSHVLPRTARIRTAGPWWYDIVGTASDTQTIIIDNARMWRHVILLTCILHEARGPRRR
jgi:hypothetical protein